MLGQRVFSENERKVSENLESDIQKIALYLDNPHSRGTSWNTANGNDVIIGAKARKMHFRFYLAKNILQGGIKRIYFIYEIII